MNQRICTLLGCRFPVIEGGLAYVGNGTLAAAVSEGGGFGQIGAGGRSAEDLEQQIQVALDVTSAPLGVNVPLSEHRDPSAYFKVIEKYAARLKAVSLSAGNPRPYISELKAQGLVVMTLASTPDQALKAELSGADAVICEGTEAGGHNGPAELTTMTLIPLVKRKVSIPIVAAGGIGNGRTAAAAFCLGADAVQLGTRFVATIECQAHSAYKAALVQARADDTTAMERSLGRITRVLKSEYVEKVLQQEQLTPGHFEYLLPLISGKTNAIAALEGRVQEGWLNCGQSVGFIETIEPAGDVVRNLMVEVKTVLQEQSQTMLGFMG